MGNRELTQQLPNPLPTHVTPAPQTPLLDIEVGTAEVKDGTEEIIVGFSELLLLEEVPPTPPWTQYLKMVNNRTRVGECNSRISEYQVSAGRVNAWIPC